MSAPVGRLQRSGRPGRSRRPGRSAAGGVGERASRAVVVAVAAVALVTAGCHPRPVPGQPRPHGIQVEVRAESSAERYRGELLAVSPDSIWIALGDAPDYTHSVPRQGAVVLPRSGGQLRPLRWATWSGLVTGIGLAISCASYTGDASCMGIIPTAMASHYLVGGFAWIARELDPAEPMDTSPEALRRFARFPAGLPQGYRDR